MSKFLFWWGFIQAMRNRLSLMWRWRIRLRVWSDLESWRNWGILLPWTRQHFVCWTGTIWSCWSGYLQTFESWTLLSLLTVFGGADFMSILLRLLFSFELLLPTLWAHSIIFQCFWMLVFLDVVHNLPLIWNLFLRRNSPNLSISTLLSFLAFSIFSKRLLFWGCQVRLWSFLVLVERSFGRPGRFWVLELDIWGGSCCTGSAHLRRFLLLLLSFVRIRIVSPIFAIWGQKAFTASMLRNVFDCETGDHFRILDSTLCLFCCY